MIKRIVSIALIIILLAAPLSAFAAMSLSNFDRVRTYEDAFTDVAPTAWYFEGIRSVYERGIMDGRGGGIFDPDGRLTIAETIKIAATLHRGYHSGTLDFTPGSPWFAPYVEYARRNGIHFRFNNMNAIATRADFAMILSSALPDEAITRMNRVDDGAIPDVLESYSYGRAVYRLYRAGILTGADRSGAFFPGRTLSRAEAATMIMRVVDAGTRASQNMVATLTAEEVYDLASPAVFFVQVFGSDGRQIKTGSGFFISETGMAITNYHVIIGATSARVTLSNGEVKDVVGIYDYDWKLDAAIIEIDGDGFQYLELADSSELLTGATVFALGSPLGLQASFSRGIVSQARREINYTDFIQLDAAISSGSSGGALIDTTGRVVGVTSATMLDSQNINLAIPINAFSSLDKKEHKPLDSILIPTLYYASFYPAPNFGSFFNIRLFNSDNARGRTTFAYRLSDFDGDIDAIIDEYTHLVEQNLFEHTGYLRRGELRFRVYENSRHNVTLVLGIEEVRGHMCFTVGVS